MKLMDKHQAMMQKHRQIIGLYVLLEDEQGNMFEIPASVTKVKEDDIASDIFRDKQSIKCKIMVNDLKSQEAPLFGFKNITYKRQEYVVVNPSVVGGFDDAIVLYGVIYGQ